MNFEKKRKCNRTRILNVIKDLANFNLFVLLKLTKIFGRIEFVLNHLYFVDINPAQKFRFSRKRRKPNSIDNDIHALDE